MKKIEPRFAQLDRTIEFHLGDGKVVSRWNGAVAIGEDAEIDICLLDHAQRGFNRVSIFRREIFHHFARLEPGAFAGQPDLLAMLREVPRRARNHHDLALYGLALWHYYLRANARSFQ